MLAVLLLCGGALGADEFAPGWNGLAEKPSMGWRPWNSFRNFAYQDTLSAVAKALTARNRTIRGDEKDKVSLCDLGYCELGVSEGYEVKKGNTMHDVHGNPLINKDHFPDMKKLTDEAHRHGLTIGWYLNSCNFGGEQNNSLVNYQGDVRNLLELGFDGAKIDGCGNMLNFTLYAELMRDMQEATGKAFIFEDCRDAGECSDPRMPGVYLCPTAKRCPWNRFRTSNDIQAFAEGWFWNLQTVVRWTESVERPVSQPHCWAYPDMLEIGLVQEPVAGSTAWNRAHFGAWCIISSPLILGLNILDQEQLLPYLDVIGNREAIAVNQRYAGHPGRLVKSWTGSELNRTTGDEHSQVYVWALPCNDEDETQRGWEYNSVSKTIKAPNGKCISYDTDSAGITLTLEDCRMSSMNQYLAYNNDTQGFGNPTLIAPPPYNNPNRGMCLTVFGWQLPVCGDKPSAKLYPCLGDQTDQKWVIEHTNSSIRDECGYCLAYRPHVPQSPDTVVQLWVKPQPNNRVAVLMINNSPDQQQFPIDFAKDLGMKDAGPVKVRDIWLRKDVGAAIKSGVYKPTIPPYDSGFFLMEPVSSTSMSNTSSTSTTTAKSTQ